MKSVAHIEVSRRRFAPAPRPPAPARVGLLVLTALVLAGAPASAAPFKRYSPANRKRPLRGRTDYIVLHTTEAPGASAFRKLFQNGEAHYFVDRAGSVKPIIQRDRLAYHAGRSMWQGRTNIDRYSIGIEVEGYYSGTLTDKQYTALKKLLAELKRIYKVSDARVLTHSMVAYGAPNRWFSRPHRGRKRCGMLFALRSVRRRLGLLAQPRNDPDVAAGRLTVGDPYLARMLYATAAPKPVAQRK
jgi:N-acetylmuramoyl-L-alanine amidase